MYGGFTVVTIINKNLLERRKQSRSNYCEPEAPIPPVKSI